MLQSGRLSARADLGAPRSALCTYGAASIGRTAQKHGLLGLGMAREFDLDAVLDHAPAIPGERVSEKAANARYRRSPKGEATQARLERSARAKARDARARIQSKAS
jgi:hypothetical protein